MAPGFKPLSGMEQMLVNMIGKDRIEKMAQLMQRVEQWDAMLRRIEDNQNRIMQHLGIASAVQTLPQNSGESENGRHANTG